jgi:tripartite-type tricarboxylate transporter receptor subunit TctC
MKRRDAIVATIALGSGYAAAPAWAQGASQWPSRTIRIVVPSPPASATDMLARVLAERLAPILGQSVIVENRPGGGTNIGTDYVAKQPADGHTILLTQNTLATNVSFYKKLPFDPVKDLDPVSLIANTPLVMVVNITSSVKTVADLVALAKSRHVTFASAGVGSPHHLAAVLFSSTSGVEMTHVAYKGSSPAALAVISQEVDMAFSTVGALMPHIQSGRLRALGVVEDRRTPMLPDVPPIGETVPGVSLNVWLGVLVRSGTPKAIVARLNSEINTIMKDRELTRTKLYAAGIDAVGTTPEQFAAVIRSDISKYAKITADAKITPE